MSALNAGGNGYPSCQPPNCLYGIDGATLDWSYGELGIPGFTTELRGGLWPQYSCLDNPGCGSSVGIWPENRSMLIYQAKIARAPYLLTRGPDANIVTSTPMTVTQGTETRLSSTINYAWTGNNYLQNVAAAEYYIDTPPWAGGTPFPMTPTDGSYNSPTEGVEATISTGSLSVGRHLLFVRGRGINDYQGYRSWGPISAAFLDILPGATPTPATNTPVPRTAATTQTSVAATGTYTPPMPTGTATSMPTHVATPCATTFMDVPPTHTFYESIRCLACRGVLGGYADGTFRPGSDITRGQIAKVVSNAAGFIEPVSGQSFEDVPTSSTFYEWIERLAYRGVMGGYQCGTIPQEPCSPPDNRPYFRPFANATRGQISKIVSNAAGYSEPVSGNFYADVDESNPFYVEIMRLTSRGVMSGYPCGGEGEPCDPQNQPYFRWGNPVTRGQASKIVANTFFPNCQTPR
jgi:hypothetical protein